MPQEQHRATSRVLDLLELLSGADGTGYTLTELSQALDIPKSSLFPILHTLEQRRYVLWDKRSGQYSIGVSAYVLGASFPAQRGLVALRHVMQEVVDRCQETCQLGVLDQGSILYLEKVDSPQAIRLISRVGTDCRPTPPPWAKPCSAAFLTTRSKRSGPPGCPGSPATP